MGFNHLFKPIVTPLSSPDALLLCHIVVPTISHPRGWEPLRSPDPQWFWGGGFQQPRLPPQGRWQFSCDALPSNAMLAYQQPLSSAKLRHVLYDWSKPSKNCCQCLRGIRNEALFFFIFFLQHCFVLHLRDHHQEEKRELPVHLFYIILDAQMLSGSPSAASFQSAHLILYIFALHRCCLEGMRRPGVQMTTPRCVLDLSMFFFSLSFLILMLPVCFLASFRALSRHF